MKYLNMLAGNIFSFICLIIWIMGVVLAKGFWLTTLSICFPFYAWYLVVERFMAMAGIV